MNARRIAAAALALCGVAGASPPVVETWAVDWRSEDVADALAVAQAPGALATISIFALRFDGSGRVASVAQPQVLQRARGAGLRTEVTMVNDVVADGAASRRKDPAIVHDILAAPARSAALVAALADAVRDGGYAGLDLDFEDLYASDRDAFSAFAAALAQRLHAQGATLTVTVQPQLRAETRDGPGAQDLAALARVADEVRVMAYHVHHDGTEAGPAAPWSWTGELLAWVTAQVPPEKLSIAFFAGGWRWRDGHAAQLSHAEALVTAQALGLPVHWSPEERQPWFGDERVTVWFEDGCSLLAKSRLLEAHRVRGIALWRLGSEDRAAFAGLKENRCEPAAAGMG